MNVNLSDHEKSQAKVLFASYQEVVDRAKEISEEKKAVIENFSKILDCKKNVGGKILAALQKKHEGEEPIESDVLDGVLAFTEE